MNVDDFLLIAEINDMLVLILCEVADVLQVNIVIALSESSICEVSPFVVAWTENNSEFMCAIWLRGNNFKLVHLAKSALDILEDGDHPRVADMLNVS